ncbi:hypothetical protein [Rhizobium leguminosarum]|uniref:hypothetical protein n=1 Tax=Rhizobium leguminosarum TaxID=384 RepID=UPI0017A96188|nr:hypothetical protein [Rhizobium leguminosarum]MBA8835164.1 cytochrome c-type biogenesis protein CcmH/NrfF [Rhizobium leguminosarum]
MNFVLFDDRVSPINAAVWGNILRKITSLIFGLALLVGGLWGFGYMLFHSGPVKILFWTIPIGAFALGVAILWEDVGDYLKRDNRI